LGFLALAKLRRRPFFSLFEAGLDVFRGEAFAWLLDAFLSDSILDIWILTHFYI
jgi:hypothetical protein